MDGWVGGWRVRIRGEYRLALLYSLKQKEKNYAVFYFAGKRKIFVLYL